MNNIFQYNFDTNSIFLKSIDNIISNLDYKLTEKTYLLIPDPNKEIAEIEMEYFLKNKENMSIHYKKQIIEIIKKFYSVCLEIGFTIITDIKQYKNDGLFFDLLGRSFENRGNIIEEENNIPGVIAPKTLSFNEFSENIFFPVVAKNVISNRGKGKYLIEDMNQLKKLFDFLELPENIILKNQFVFQQYIEGYSDLNNSMRVLTTCTGDILSSTLLISSNDKTVLKTDESSIYDKLENPNSKYYLNSKSIVSNLAAGGKAISLNPNRKHTNNERMLLFYFGFDIDTLKLPKEIIDSCAKIANYYQNSKGIVLGIDFVYNSKDNKWYYLETNRNPGIDGYAKYYDFENFSRKDVKTLVQLEALTKIVNKIGTKQNRKAK